MSESFSQDPVPDDEVSMPGAFGGEAYHFTLPDRKDGFEAKRLA